MTSRTMVPPLYRGVALARCVVCTRDLVPDKCGGSLTDPETITSALISTAGSSEVGLFPEDASSPEQIINDLLNAIRLHLGMETAFISEFSDDQRVFRFVDAGLESPGLRVGGGGRW